MQKGSRRIEDLLDDLDPSLNLASKAVPMRRDPRSDLYFVDLVLERGAPPVPVIVDLGSGMSIVNWRAAESVRHR